MYKYFKKRTKTEDFRIYKQLGEDEDERVFENWRYGDSSDLEQLNYLPNDNNFRKEYKRLHGFDKRSDCSYFGYWFAHWCGFQMQALIMGAWRFRFLFHDIEKPWSRLLFGKKFTKQWHREHSKHHLEYGLKNGWDKVDWEALVIDWECSRLSKIRAQFDATETLQFEISGKWSEYTNEILPRVRKILDKYEL